MDGRRHGRSNGIKLPARASTSPLFDVGGNLTKPLAKINKKLFGVMHVEQFRT